MITNLNKLFKSIYEPLEQQCHLLFYVKIIKKPKM